MTILIDSDGEMIEFNAEEKMERLIKENNLLHKYKDEIMEFLKEKRPEEFI